MRHLATSPGVLTVIWRMRVLGWVHNKTILQNGDENKNRNLCHSHHCRFLPLPAVRLLHAMVAGNGRKNRRPQIHQNRQVGRFPSLKAWLPWSFFQVCGRRVSRTSPNSTTTTTTHSTTAGGCLRKNTTSSTAFFCQVSSSQPSSSWP